MGGQLGCRIRPNLGFRRMVRRAASGYRTRDFLGCCRVSVCGRAKTRGRGNINLALQLDGHTGSLCPVWGGGPSWPEVLPPTGRPRRLFPRACGPRCAGLAETWVLLLALLTDFPLSSTGEPISKRSGCQASPRDRPIAETWVLQLALLTNFLPHLLPVSQFPKGQVSPATCRTSDQKVLASCRRLGRGGWSAERPPSGSRINAHGAHAQHPIVAQ